MLGSGDEPDPLVIKKVERRDKILYYKSTTNHEKEESLCSRKIILESCSIKEVKTDGIHQIMIFLITLEVMVLIIQFASVVILQNIFFGVLSFIPFIAMVGGFEYAYQKKANEQNERTIQFRKRFYKVSAWLGAYFPIRLLAMALVHFYPRPINSLALERVIAVLYLMTATLITLEIEKRHLSKN